MKQAVRELIAELLPVLGEQGGVASADVAARSAGIWKATNIVAEVIFRPVNTGQVAAILRAGGSRCIAACG